MGPCKLGCTYKQQLWGLSGLHPSAFRRQLPEIVRRLSLRRAAPIIKMVRSTTTNTRGIYLPSGHLFAKYMAPVSKMTAPISNNGRHVFPIWAAQLGGISARQTAPTSNGVAPPSTKGDKTFQQEGGTYQQDGRHLTARRWYRSKTSGIYQEFGTYHEDRRYLPVNERNLSMRGRCPSAIPTHGSCHQGGATLAREAAFQQEGRHLSARRRHLAARLRNLTVRWRVSVSKRAVPQRKSGTHLLEDDAYHHDGRQLSGGWYL